MSYKEYEFLTAYNKAEHNIADSFYLPCVREAIRYDRVSGYFGSTIYIIAWDALQAFIEHGGKMRLVCSPYVSEEDAAALAEGYSARTDEILSKAITQEVETLFSMTTLSAPSRLLAYMVSQGIIDVKIAVLTGQESPNAKRLFHDKVGIFCDTAGNRVGFRGSMNETFMGLSSDGNMESIDVFPDWLDVRDAQRLSDADNFFANVWAGRIAGITIHPFPDASREILKTKAEGVHWKELLSEIQVGTSLAQKWKPSKAPKGRIPRTHQVNALETWVKNGRRGIFEHATGSGKTFTSMCTIWDSIKRGEIPLVLVPSRNLLNQWAKELTETLTDTEIFYLLCGDGNNEWKKGNTLKNWSSPGGKPRIIVAIMDTASSDDFIHKLAAGDHLFVVADEVHRLGSRRRRDFFQVYSGPRLGLSATPRRYGDQVGTNAILSYFGDILPPAFTLMDAINSNVLTRYYYNPLKIELTQQEQADWDAVTEEITKLIARLGSDKSWEENIASHPRLKQLLITRARIVKNASGKVDLAVDLLMQKFEAKQRWIIYCDNTTQLKAVLKRALALKIDACEYYADMAGNRDETLKYFAKNGGVLVSIKCLDEGVDIPSATHALILASSQNPREFIQRRGRILRKSKGKIFAHLYDAITIPRIEEAENIKSLSIVMGELSRAIQFGSGAENPACISDLKNIAVDFRIDYNTIREEGMEDDDD